MNKKGIAVAGNMIVDLLYPVQGLPNPGELTTISGEASRSTGGLLCNCALDLALLDPELTVTALGRTGNDAESEVIMNAMRRCPNIDLSLVKREGQTSFTLVMLDQITKQRTFYHCRGGNAAFCEEDIPWEKLNVDLLHVGYILLLDALDQPDDEFGTKMARLLHTAQSHGIRTSVDIVTETGDRTGRLAPPALRYADYCIINETEATGVTGVPLRTEDGALLTENMPLALQKMKELGVSTWAVIHCPEAGFGLDENNQFVTVPSLKLPEGYIKGSVGAGDAFCSGVLYAAWKGETLTSALELGTATAACSLSEPGSTEGVRTAVEARRLYESMR
ncbi:MAG: carbohydrate kinase family protein [Clostridia bacterium]|nr:carbohydrate kinase family protein [Clostridia bacterium]